MTRSNPITNFADLCAALEVTGVAGFEDWLEGVHDENDWMSAQTDYDESRLLVLIDQAPIQDVDFRLTFPCKMDDVWRAVKQMEQTVERHQAVMYNPVEAFGTGDGQDDDIATLARLLDVSEAGLAKVLGGPWTPVEDGPVWDCNGDVIYQWFSRDQPGPVWLGLGGDSVYVEPVATIDGTTQTLAEWPEPATATLRYAMAESFDLPEHEFLTRLQNDLNEATNMATYPTSHHNPTQRKRSSMADHDVRLSTANLRLAGIDLDFTVKIDGATLGTLAVSEGGLLWRPAHRQKKNGVDIPWAAFAEWAES